MSCNEWERGSIKVPSSEWTSFKVKVKNAYNNLVQQDYNIALKLYQNLLEDAKGKRKYNFRYNLVINLQKLNLKWYRAERIETALFPPSEHLATRRRKPFKPKKKNFNRINNQTEKIELGLASIGFSNLTKTFFWYVEENNRAVSEAHDDPFVKIIFEALTDVDWKRNSGGVIVGNDEYNREATHPGGANNYITYSYGPIGLKISKSRGYAYIENVPSY